MSEPRELPDVLTPCTPPQLARELAWAWVGLFTTPPEPKQLSLLLAQWALETGRGKSCHSWNLGNAKSTGTDGRSWTYFGCDEVIGQAQARGLVAASPLAHITKTFSDGTARVWFDAPHPWSRFRAFETLREGATDYLGMLSMRFKSAWPYVVSGDPSSFVHECRRLGYFTAPEVPYRNAVVSLFAEFLPQVTPEMIADVSYYHSAVADGEARARLDSLLALSLAEQGRELADDAGPATEPSA